MAPTFRARFVAVIFIFGFTYAVVACMAREVLALDPSRWYLRVITFVLAYPIFALWLKRAHRLDERSSEHG